MGFEKDNNAINESILKQNIAKKVDHSSSRYHHYVYGVKLVKALPFYGYCSTEKLWIKILFFNPKDVGRAAALLLAGAVLGRKWQPHESHVPYILQAKVDLNLHGMGWIYCDKFFFRTPLPPSLNINERRLGWAVRSLIQEQEPTSRVHFPEPLENSEEPLDGKLMSPTDSTSTSAQISWLQSNVSSERTWNTSISAVEKQTTCELELDASAIHILNRGSLRQIPLEQAGEDVRMVESLAPMWAEECSRGSPPEVKDHFNREPQTLGPIHESLRQRFIDVGEEQRRQMMMQGIDMTIEEGHNCQSIEQKERKPSAIEQDIESFDNSLPNDEDKNSLSHDNRLIGSTQPANEEFSTALSDVNATASCRMLYCPTEDEIEQMPSADSLEMKGESLIDEDIVLATQTDILSASQGFYSQELLYAGDDNPEKHAMHGTVYEVEEKFAAEEHDLLMQLANNLSADIKETFREQSEYKNFQNSIDISENRQKCDLVEGKMEISHSNTQQELVDHEAAILLNRYIMETQQECDDIMQASLEIHEEIENYTEVKSEEKNSLEGRKNDGCVERIIESTEDVEQHQIEEETHKLGPKSHNCVQNKDLRTILDSKHQIPQQGKVERYSCNDATEVSQHTNKSVRNVKPYASKTQVKAAMSFLARSHAIFNPASSNGLSSKSQETSQGAGKHPQRTPKSMETHNAYEELEIPRTQSIEVDGELASNNQTMPSISSEQKTAKICGARSMVNSVEGRLTKSLMTQSEEWWKEQASQIPFDEEWDNWDLMDDAENKDEEQSFECREIDSDELRIEHGIEVAHTDTNLDSSDGYIFLFKFRKLPPCNSDLVSSCWNFGLQPIVHQGPYYSDPSDVPEKPVVFAGKEFRIKSLAPRDLENFSSPPMLFWNMKHEADISTERRNVFVLTFARPPPSQEDVRGWLSSTRNSSIPISSPSSEETKTLKQNDFNMDANTGRLLPKFRSNENTNKTGNSSETRAWKQNRAVFDVEEDSDDLLITPPLPSLSHSTMENKKYLTPMLRSTGKTKSQHEPKDKNIPDPASPKYDERTFFYSNPYVLDEVLIPCENSQGRKDADQIEENCQGRRMDSHGTDKDLILSKLEQSDSHTKDSIHVVKNDFELSKSKLEDQANITTKASKVDVDKIESINNRTETATKPKLTTANDARPITGGINVSCINKKSRLMSQITPPTAIKPLTPPSQLGFKRTIAGKGEGLTLASVEVLADCRGQLLPDPRYDPIRVVAIAIMDDDENVTDGNYFVRMIVLDEKIKERQSKELNPSEAKDNATTVLKHYDGFQGPHQIDYCMSEKELITLTVRAIQSLDPDILMGFEVQQGSLGYLAERAATAYEQPNFLSQISRIPSMNKSNSTTEENEPDDTSNRDQYSWQHASGLHVSGRIVLNVWRIMRDEVKLNIYTLENCVAAVLHLRIPHFPHYQLVSWFSRGLAGGRWRSLAHLAMKTRMSLMLLDRLDVVGRTAEMARCFGIDFFSVLSRGSQYRVESMVLRLAHTQNYIALAPSPEQVARQAAMEALPLILEPQSQIYVDPVCVLDFQSLYPSMIIAYNLCYSTCIGKPEHSRPDNMIKLGCSEYHPGISVLAGKKPGAHRLIIAPNGVGFVPPDVRNGILPRLLKEILETRIMVKKSMKRLPPDARVLLRCLNARQFSLKLIANVTYGYTAAGFSGRMPMAELADAIVQSGRETLESAIKMVESNPRWRARVVYGDTDSLFVQLPGRSIEDAFEIGSEIAKAVTEANPSPVTLKLEKIYQPCVLLSKKRYAGAMYESPDQVKAAFDAKGIETVRRDTCPAVAKVLERTLRLLFASADLSILRQYLENQWKRILSNRISISDFIFAKEVRLGTYSARASVIPPAALVATREMAYDPRAEPRYGERVPYVVVYSEPGSRLADMVVSPRALVESSGRLRLHGLYYITKQIIPAVERILSIIGADVRHWFSSMPRPSRMLPLKRPAGALPLDDLAMFKNTMSLFGLVSGETSANNTNKTNSTIDLFYLSRHCAVCDEMTNAKKPLCKQCTKDPQLATAVLSARVNNLQRQYINIVKVCMRCGGGSFGSAFVPIENGGIACDSLDCGLFFERKKVMLELQSAESLAACGLD